VKYEDLERILSEDQGITKIVEARTQRSSSTARSRFRDRSLAIGPEISLLSPTQFSHFSPINSAPEQSIEDVE